MKRRGISALLALWLCTMTAGCAPGALILENYRNVESLEVINCLGVDRAGDEQAVSLSSAVMPEEGKPLRMRQTGQSVQAAMQKLRGYSDKLHLFFGHTEHLLVGEEAAECGIGELLDLVERSNQLSFGTYLYIVSDGTAAELLLQAGDAETDPGSIFSALGRSLRDDSLSQVFSVGETQRSLNANGAALVCAVTAAETEDVMAESEGGLTALPAGYAILRGETCAGFLTGGAARAATLLTGGGALGMVTLETETAGTVTLSLISGKCKLTPVWTGNGALRQMAVHAELFASVLELEEPENIYQEAFLSQTEAALIALYTDWISEALAAEQETEADFLGLTRRVQLASPRKFSRISETLPTAFFDGRVTFSVEVTAMVGRSGEMTDPAQEEAP